MAYDGTYLPEVSTKRQASTVYKRASAAATADGNSGSLFVGVFDELSVDVNVSAVAGTNTPSMTLYVDRLGADGVWYPIYTSSAVTAAAVVSTSLGRGAATNATFGATARLRWVITGTTPSFTFSASIVGK